MRSILHHVDFQVLHVFLFWHTHFLFSIRFTYIWPFCFLCKSTNSSWVAECSDPTSCLKFFIYARKTQAVFSPTAVVLGLQRVEITNLVRSQSTAALVLLETAQSVLDKSFSSPPRHPHEERAVSRFAWGSEVDRGNGGNQAWLAALFISRQTLRREMNTCRAICERMALVQQSSLSPCIVQGGAGNNRGQTAQTKRPVHRLQTHPHACSSVSEVHGQT